MYNLKRSEKITETLCLIDRNNVVKDKLVVEIDADTIAEAFVTKQEKFIFAQKQLKEIQRSGRKDIFDATYQAYGEALIDFFSVIFGTENTCKLLEFYENRYVEMLMYVVPFINSKVVPAIYAAAEYNKQQLKRLKKHR